MASRPFADDAMPIYPRWPCPSHARKQLSPPSMLTPKHIATWDPSSILLPAFTHSTPGWTLTSHHTCLLRLTGVNQASLFFSTTQWMVDFTRYPNTFCKQLLLFQLGDYATNCVSRDNKEQGLTSYTEKHLPLQREDNVLSDNTAQISSLTSMKGHSTQHRFPSHLAETQHCHIKGTWWVRLRLRLTTHS